MAAQRQWRRGPSNALHKAATLGSHELTATILRRQPIDIDRGNPDGVTPLMIAAQGGYPRVAKILLEKGANAKVTADNGFTALHCSCHGHVGHLEVAKMLVEAGGSDLEARDGSSMTPLHIAADRGHWQVASVLIKAGADVDTCQPCGSTPLFNAAFKGHIAAVRVLLLGKANPLLGKRAALDNMSSLGETSLPLDVAAQEGHSGVVRELLQQCGIDGCSRGANRGQAALVQAAGRNHVDVMELLAAAGVVDLGTALLEAAEFGREASVKFLLQQHQKKRNAEAGGLGYLNVRNRDGATPLSVCVRYARVSPRIVRLLVDAGADATSFIALREPTELGGFWFRGTPLGLATHFLSDGFRLEGVSDEQVNRLKAAHRLLTRVEAVHAVSWLWPSDAPSSPRGVCTASSATAATLTTTLPVLRRRARRPRLVLASLFR